MKVTVSRENQTTFVHNLFWLLSDNLPDGPFWPRPFQDTASAPASKRVTNNVNLLCRIFRFFSSAYFS